MPRVWFVSDDDNYIIQLQNNRFLFNWRSVRRGDAYPRFDTVQSGFLKYFAMFQDFVESNALGDLVIHNYELTYINHIERVDKYRKLQHIGSLFPDLRWRTPKKRFLPAPSHLTWNLGFEFGDQGRLTVDVKPAQRRSDKSDLYVLELKALGDAHVGQTNDVTAWFEQAREWIVRGFADLTSKSAQVQLWGLENGDE